MPDLWLPGSDGPLDQLVDRILRQIERFTSEHSAERTAVEAELLDGTRVPLRSLSADPGYAS